MTHDGSGFERGTVPDTASDRGANGVTDTPSEGGATTRVVRGHVKWFDPAKGFGFVVSDAGGADILLHANVLRNFGQSSVADGVGIEIAVQDTPRGVQAVKVIGIDRVDAHVPAGLQDFEDIDDSEIAALERQPARVKWFDKVKGFGFANAFGTADDIFIHIEVLRRSGLADLQPGEAICVQVITGKRGQMAATVESWESVCS
ncbi:MAG: cold shock domain-containing protein [Pseudomonadota bacterium]